MNHTSLCALATTVALTSFLVPPARGQAAGPSGTVQAQTPQKDGQKTDSKAELYVAAVKDLKRVGGPFPLYIRKNNVLAEISDDQLGKIMLCETNLATGFSELPYQAGDPVGDTSVEAYRLEKHDDEIWLIRPNIKYRWSKDDPLAIASERSLPEAVLASYRIEQTDPQKKLY
ncbi:MAG TPA: hypothetical protein VMI31_00410, partial [Fimbriimonadaceae bacterium]|nr:hypothetical protein [Fimbriimonadaceae bacterium]